MSVLKNLHVSTKTYRFLVGSYPVLNLFTQISNMPAHNKTSDVGIVNVSAEILTFITNVWLRYCLIGFGNYIT